MLHFCTKRKQNCNFLCPHYANTVYQSNPSTVPLWSNHRWYYSHLTRLFATGGLDLKAGKWSFYVVQAPVAAFHSGFFTSKLCVIIFWCVSFLFFKRLKECRGGDPGWLFFNAALFQFSPDLFLPIKFHLFSLVPGLANPITATKSTT
jgi:hypothetical protein